VTKTFKRRDKVEVVHNGIAQPDVDRQTGRQRLEEAVGGVEGAVVALVGRLDPVKGHRELLAMAADLPARLVFIGGPDASHPGYEDQLRGEAGENAVFLGHREDTQELIAGCDVLAIPTVVPEGFPYVGLEAMAVGTAVVGYAHGGLPELVGSCGRLAPPGDRAALFAEIAQLLENSEESAACGRDRVAREFSLGPMIDEMKDLYRRAAGN
jgi:glycosyltransferase involved in cell wall biosynthesis